MTFPSACGRSSRATRFRCLGWRDLLSTCPRGGGGSVPSSSGSSWCSRPRCRTSSAAPASWSMPSRMRSRHFYAKYGSKGRGDRGTVGGPPATDGDVASIREIKAAIGRCALVGARLAVSRAVVVGRRGLKKPGSRSQAAWPPRSPNLAQGSFAGRPCSWSLSMSRGSRLATVSAVEAALASGAAGDPLGGLDVPVGRGWRRAPAGEQSGRARRRAGARCVAGQDPERRHERPRGRPSSARSPARARSAFEPRCGRWAWRLYSIVARPHVGRGLAPARIAN